VIPGFSHYLKYSLVLHAALLAALVLAPFIVSPPEPKRLKMVVVPKGTSRNAVLTQNVLSQMALPSDDSRRTQAPPAKSPTPQSAATIPTPDPTAARTPEPTPKVTPPPTPTEPKPTAQPLPKDSTATPKPEKTAAPKPTATLKPTATPKPSPEKKPTATPKPAAKNPPPDKKSPQKVEVTKTPKATPKIIASAYEEEVPKETRPRNLPRETPVGATVEDQVPAGKVAGVPGIAEGVEGAPLALDAEESPLPPVYSNRAVMLLGRNFRVPPEMNEPHLICVVEWDILPNGKFENVKVVKSTGSEEYDRMATDAVFSVGQLDPLPGEFRGQALRVSYPFVYGSE